MSNVASAINPHAAQPTSLVALFRSLWRNRQLIVQMTKREVVGRYKGSAMGLAWSFFNPVFMLVVYTFVFSVIFRSRWGGSGGDGSTTQFAVLLFVGMIVLSLFSDVLNRAPSLILCNVNYVKKWCSRSKYCLSLRLGQHFFTVSSAWAYYLPHSHSLTDACTGPSFLPLWSSCHWSSLPRASPGCWHPWGSSCAMSVKPSSSLRLY